ncbi:peptidase A4 family-domain-containing protein [Daldinia caldariorum]|uniref:peptidase A4 family-domain-containing protein n=1 Tax=Daldinia caldariorum TaxID=326644 RepID=UPI0020086DB1|nr:peptidase A4 family-domain-containing protein [Daldinia caldariorum]KAI1467561.1 peptidase A4 family-domain-containing protein [Daldinia caldariorum]
MYFLRRLIKNIHDKKNNTSYIQITLPTMRFSTSNTLIAGLLASTTFAAFDQNRGGAVLKAPEGQSFTSATGTFTVPNLSGPNKLSIWVAIGDTLAQDVVLNGGITYSNGLTSFAGWFPANETDITSAVPIKAGDSIIVTLSVSVSETDKSTGTVVVENTTQNGKSTQTLPLPAKVGDPSKLTSLAADWFVQAYQNAGELVRVPRFGTIAFTRSSATLADGATVGPVRAGTFEIQGTSGQIHIFQASRFASYSEETWGCWEVERKTGRGCLAIATTSIKDIINVYKVYSPRVQLKIYR